MAIRRRVARRRLARRMRMRGFRSGKLRKTTMLKSVHRFKETVQVASLSAGGANSAGGRLSFLISDLTNWTHFQGLFDLYKITGVKVKLVPKWNVSDPLITPNANGAAGGLPMLYIAANHDPYVPAPVNAGDVLNDDGCKIIRLTRPINLYISNPKPDITNAGGNIPFQFGAGKKFQPWLTTGGNGQTVNQENVPHYGYRWYIANGNGNYEVDVDVYLTYYFSMKEQD